MQEKNHSFREKLLTNSKIWDIILSLIKIIWGFFMSFSKISKILMSFSFLGMFACGIIAAQEPAAPEIVESVASSNDKSDASVASVDSSSSKENDLVCKDLGSFTMNSTFVKQSSHFGLFKDDNGFLIVKDITDDNKDSKDKKRDCKTIKVSYTCNVCYYPNCEENNGNTESKSDSDTPKNADEVKSESNDSTNEENVELSK